MKKTIKLLSIILALQLLGVPMVNVFADSFAYDETIEQGLTNTTIDLLSEPCYIVNANGQMKMVTIVGSQVTLQIGETLVCPGYKVFSGQGIRVTWTLKKSAALKVSLYKGGSVYSSSIVSGPSGYKNYTANGEAYYSVHFTNAQSAPLTIMGATMVWPT